MIVRLFCRERLLLKSLFVISFFFSSQRNITFHFAKTNLSNEVVLSCDHFGDGKILEDFKILRSSGSQSVNANLFRNRNCLCWRLAFNYVQLQINDYHIYKGMPLRSCRLVTR